MPPKSLLSVIGMAPDHKTYCPNTFAPNLGLYCVPKVNGCPEGEFLVKKFGFGRELGGSLVRG